MYVSVGYRLEPYLNFIIVQFKCTYILTPISLQVIYLLHIMNQYIPKLQGA